MREHLATIVEDFHRYGHEIAVVRTEGNRRRSATYGEIASLAGRFAAAEEQGREMSLPPLTTSLGALLNHVTGGANPETFQPMNVNFGLFPEPEKEYGKKMPKGRDRKTLYSIRGRKALTEWMEGL